MNKLIPLAIVVALAIPTWAMAQEAPCPDDRTPVPYVPKNTGSKEVFHKPVKAHKAAAKKTTSKKSSSKKKAVHKK